MSRPRIFEWNLFHHHYLKKACVDIDGVLCRDPLEFENDDGQNYRNFLSSVEPNVIPTQKIGWLVTCRLEKYRSLTERWLEKHGIAYEHLFMMDYATQEERVRDGKHAEFKANIYSGSDAILFIESSENQAVKISKYSKKPVISYGCISHILNSSKMDNIKRKAVKYIHELIEDSNIFALKGFEKIGRKADQGIWFE